ncbi:MAG: hypothetical protein HC790_12035 [Acaryochloridaceae cyanobacterium CSU_3_4]|nr:hypothetical protein [Acaryochloridaceae cyanobacterium CSU_3_4]
MIDFDSPPRSSDLLRDDLKEFRREVQDFRKEIHDKFTGIYLLLIGAILVTVAIAVFQTMNP